MLVMERLESHNETNNNNTVHKGTWHEHIYANPPKQPTPHYIQDILGWKQEQPLNLTIKSRRNSLDFREPQIQQTHTKKQSTKTAITKIFEFYHLKLGYVKTREFRSLYSSKSEILGKELVRNQTTYPTVAKQKTLKENPCR
ncbi:hypothetical protein O3M35_006363 [Rhynocoris fuscipes]|uniref:Uncharacterized protein n=1 Tax=Rhynocoris fuscipes TaxID=488301 RepID=A0AAW1DET4_9HEMI